MAKHIPLTQNQFTIISDIDYARVRKYKWCAAWNNSTKSFYAVRVVGSKTIQLAAFILNLPTGLQPDHKDGNTLNNKRSNLRSATRSQNCANRSKRSDNTSGFKGVCFDKSRRNSRVWLAQITYMGKTKHLGHYETSVQAAYAYDQAAKQLYGKFAKLNFNRG